MSQIKLEKLSWIESNWIRKYEPCNYADGDGGSRVSGMSPFNTGSWCSYDYNGFFDVRRGAYDINVYVDVDVDVGYMSGQDYM